MLRESLVAQHKDSRQTQVQAGGGPDLLSGLPGVSRETLDRLILYADLLQRWQARINLVGPATLPDLWRRHMLDSAQLMAHLPAPVGALTLADIGSGAGFPGLVLAALGVGQGGVGQGESSQSSGHVHLIESDARKCAFLREAARIMGLSSVTIHTRRIEAAALPRLVDCVTARALAPLDQLLTYTRRLLRPGGIALFLKGESWQAEIGAAQAAGHYFTYQAHPSITQPGAVVLAVAPSAEAPSHG